MKGTCRDRTEGQEVKSTISEALALAAGHHQAGRLPEAERIYREILLEDSHNANALHSLGLIAIQTGNRETAIDLIGRAIEIEPELAEAHNNLGNALKAQGTLDEAVACYQQALRIKPDYAEAHSNLGIALKAQGKLDEAVASYREALRIKPDYAKAHNNLGITLKNQGKLDEAVASYQRALEVRPDYAEARYNLGNALIDQGKLDEAAASYRAALQIRPDYAEAHYNLGNALRVRGQFDEAVASYQRALRIKPGFTDAHYFLAVALKQQGKFEEAAASYQRALEIRPNHAKAHNGLGNIHRTQGKADKAVACYQQALLADPDCTEAHSNLGGIFRSQGKHDQAVACYRRALQLQPDYAELHNNLGNSLIDQGKQEEAIASYRRALQIKPSYPTATVALVHQLQHVCDWEGIGDLSRRVIEEIDTPSEHGTGHAVSPFSFLALPTPTSAKQQQQCARKWVDQRLESAIQLGREMAFAHARGARSRITLGYLSGDFHSHPVAQLIAELFEKHDRGKFAVLAYSYGPDDSSPMRRRLTGAFDRFVDVKDASFVEAAQRIHADGVDILIDLKGYTQGARTQILALRPAPVQVNFLGYPGTMGAPFVDYIVVDDFIVPAEQKVFFTEELASLPGCYQVNDSRREVAPRTPSRAECDLPEEGFVFCSFNNSYKITPEVFEVWMRLLEEVPKSVLWLLEGNRFVPANLRSEAEARGVAADRLVFAPRLPLTEHLARHRLADLFLDTFPVNAHTTASDALWLGCPVVTIAGETFVSRVAGSLLRTVGLPELVTTCLDEYEDTALRLARDADQLAQLRARLEANRMTCGLFDAGRFARRLEKAYLRMWEIHASGERPRGFGGSPGQQPPS